MKRVFITSAALALTTWFAATTVAEQSVLQADYRSDSDSEKGKSHWAAALDQLGGRVEPASHVLVDQCDSPGGCETPGWGIPVAGVRPGGRFFVGGEYLALRANPSEAVSFLVRDLTDIGSPSDTFNQFDFEYDSSFRVYGGYRNDCGEEIRFTYTRFDTDSAFVSPTVPQGSNGAFQIISPLEVVATIDGGRTEGNTDIELDSFDLGWSKTIPLGSPLSGDCGCGEDVCSDACGGCQPWCPAWDITFTGAFRAVDMSAERNYRSISPAEEVLTTGHARFEFEGAGARVGMLGRRYFGPQGIFSLYLKGDLSLLVGEYDAVQQRTSSDTPGQVISQSIGCRHVIPVTEIEAGGTAYLTRNTSLSGGYFISAWHDLGFREEYDFGLQTSYDDANIMGFDGFFVRVETAF